MYGLVRVLEDGNPTDLLFANKRCAENFIRFIHTYIAESGAGNGYGAYWHFNNEPVIGVDVKREQGKLRLDLVHDMAAAICDSRTARPRPNWAGAKRRDPEYVPLSGVLDNAIVFLFDPQLLPPRLQPETGDLARIVDHPELNRITARVKEMRGENVLLVHCPYGGLEPEQEVEVPVASVMKVHDFFGEK